MSTATHTQVLDRLAEQVTDGKIGLLGYVVWFGLPDVSIQPSQLATIAAGLGLTDSPEMGSRADAFRRATTPRSRRGESRTTRFLMRPVCETGNTLIRQLVVERVDTGAVKLNHVPVAEVTFDKASGQMLWREFDEVKYLNAADVAEVCATEQESLAAFKEYTTSLTGGEIQRWVMRKLANLSHVTVHPNGAVYFIPAQYGEAARKVQKLVRSLEPYVKDKATPPSFTVVPVIDDPEQRGNVKAGLTSSVASDLKSLVADLAELLNRPSKPDQATAEHRLAQVGNVMAKVRDYEKLLGESLDALRTQVEIVQLQAETLVEKAASKEDPLIALVAKVQAEIVFSDTGKTATVTSRLNPARHVSVRFNDDGWTVVGANKLKIEDLGGRDEVTTHTDKWTARTPDPEVAMLFIRKALRLTA